jgi:hypothetical protein
MKHGDLVVCCDESSGLIFGQEYVVDTTCIALRKLTIVEQPGLFDSDCFALPLENIQAGEWFVSRAGVLLLAAHVCGDHVVVAVPSSDGGCQLELFYANGRYSETALTEQDLICRAGRGAWQIGDRVCLHRRDLFGNFSSVKEVPCVGA